MGTVPSGPPGEGEAPLVLYTQDSAGTRRVGARLALWLREGDVVLLTGDLGAGKSEFARGVARGLGVTGPVPSPSFVILNLYGEGRLALRHFDWYRISSGEELRAAGLDESLGGEGVTLIEWHERAPELLPETCLEVSLRQTGDGEREITLRGRGGLRPLPAALFEEGQGAG